MGFGAFASIAPKVSEAGGSAQFEQLRALLPGNAPCCLIVFFDFIGIHPITS